MKKKILTAAAVLLGLFWVQSTIHKKTKMKKNNKNPLQQKPGSMLNQKTNEDHNKQTPDPQDPNQTKNHPHTADANSNDDGDRTSTGETTDAQNDAPAILNKR